MSALWEMAGVLATLVKHLREERVQAVTFPHVLKANNRNGDWRALVISYTVMIIAIVISYLGGPSVSMLLKDFTVIVRFFCT